MERPLLLLAALLAMAACTADRASTSETPRSPTSTAVENSVDVEPLFRVDLDGAVAANIATNGTDSPVVAWITVDHVIASALDPIAGELAEPREVDGGVAPIAHPIERPAIAVRSDGSVDIAFTSVQGSGASVFYSAGGSEPEAISGTPQMETNLVHVTLVDDSPVLAWLEASTLSVGLEEGDMISERELVDDQTCDCCNPVPALAGDALVISYRDFEMVDGEIVRDVVAVASTDGGDTYGDVVPVADDHWFITGCPFSGPSSVVVGDDLVVAWMDGRQSVHPGQQTSSIWVDRSSDGGSTFGPDLEVTGEGLNRWPVMAVDGQGVIHLVWETAGPEGGLSYATSADDGRTFRVRDALVTRSTGDGGAPTSPSVVVHDDLLIVTWTTTSGRGHVGAWRIG